MFWNEKVVTAIPTTAIILKLMFITEDEDPTSFGFWDSIKLVAYGLTKLVIK